MNKDLCCAWCGKLYIDETHGSQPKFILSFKATIDYNPVPELVVCVCHICQPMIMMRYELSPDGKSYIIKEGDVIETYHTKKKKYPKKKSKKIDFQSSLITKAMTNLKKDLFKNKNL